jgi:pimeloyl-ACP methyl ester carboxylesterase
MRERGWGEIYNGSYGTLLYDLQSNLEMTFRLDALNQRHIRHRWKEVMQAMEGDPLERWGVRTVEPLTEEELELYAKYQYPIYACGYNWLQSCGESAKRLEKRITEIITWWQARKHECSKVILITHSMGGLVARACAKRIPDKIAGVLHGVMPALGAPLAYRRMACGTEAHNPTGSRLDEYKAGKFADIGGRRAEDTTPVLAVAPGALELLPNQLYPRPWLHVRVIRLSDSPSAQGPAVDYLSLPSDSQPNPYKLYRNMSSWYRLINPDLADPANLYPASNGGVKQKILQAISTAEKFHYGLADYYHPVTFAYCGDDPAHLTYGRICWLAYDRSAAAHVLTPGNLKKAKLVLHEQDGSRRVEVEGTVALTFAVEEQDTRGDDTVPFQSGAGPSKSAKKFFPTRGYKHQESYSKADTLLLTRYCIVKLVQEMEKNAQQK